VPGGARMLRTDAPGRRSERGNVSGSAIELAVLAETVQVGRHDGLDRSRLDAEAFQRAPFATETTLSLCSIVSWSRVISSILGKRPIISLSAVSVAAAGYRISPNGTGTKPRRRCVVLQMNSRSSLNVLTAGPPSSYAMPSRASPAAALATVAATSPTKTGWNRV